MAAHDVTRCGYMAPASQSIQWQLMILRDVATWYLIPEYTMAAHDITKCGYMAPVVMQSKKKQVVVF